MKLIYVFLLNFSLAYGVECEQGKILSTYRPQYAKLFSIKYYNGYKVVDSEDDHFIVADKKLECQSRLPVFSSHTKRFVATSTTHLPFLSVLGLEDTLVGFQGTRYIFNEALKNKKIKDINYQLNAEELLALKPDLVMAYSANMASLEKIKRLRSQKIPLVLNRDFEERHPLARAEWVVFEALFFNKDREAISHFAEIEKNYNTLKREASLSLSKKQVLVGDIQNGKWSTCGAQSDLAIMIGDAGGELVLSIPSPETQFMPLEKVLTMKKTPDVWLAQNAWQSLETMKKDSRYKAFHTLPVYNNNKLLNAAGFNDYWETGLARPDLLLKDLAIIFQSIKKTEGALVWYRKLHD